MLALVDACQATAAAKGRLCACLEPTALGRLRAIAADGRLAAGEILFTQDSAAEHVFGLRQGAVMLCSRLPGGRRQVLSFLFPGDTFGFAVGGRHACSAVALTRASVCRISADAADADPQLAGRLLRISQSWLCESHAQALRLGRMTAAERVLDFLAALWTRLDRPEEIHMPMRWVDIADHLGLRMETVSREFSALRRNGVIGPLSADNVLTITDGAALEAAQACRGKPLPCSGRD